MYRIYGISGAMDGKERYVQDVRSAYSSRQKLSTYLPVSNSRCHGRNLFPTISKYLHPCKQWQRAICTGCTVLAVPWQKFVPDNF